MAACKFINNKGSVRFESQSKLGGKGLPGQRQTLDGVFDPELLAKRFGLLQTWLKIETLKASLQCKSFF